MKLEYPKEWFLRSADIEGAAEIGVGIPTWNTDASTRGVNHPASRIAFGRFVELWRRNKGWNSEKLAEEAGLDPEEILEIGTRCGVQARASVWSHSEKVICRFRTDRATHFSPAGQGGSICSTLGKRFKAQ